jgi:hypothetical protein
MAAAEYGEWYFCVKSDLSENGEIYLHADSAHVDSNGALIFRSAGRRREGRKASKKAVKLNIAFARGSWKAVYAASVMDNSPICVEHWKVE